MLLKFKVLFFIVFTTVSCSSQKSSLWQNFKEAKENNIEPILPDFSYAGYMHSEQQLPKVNYKVFNVVNYGAIPDDTISDKAAINKAIGAAKENGEGVIYFPKGKYYINTKEDDQSIISISSSKIVFRGEDKNNTTLFFDKDLPPSDPEKFWTCPSAIKVQSLDENEYITKVIANTNRETHRIKVEDASKIKKGDWLVIQVLNNDKDLVTYDLGNLKPDKEWTSILEEGVKVNEVHQVASVKGNDVQLVSPIHYAIKAKHNWKVYRFSHVNHVGFERITFEGNWTKKFIHHRSAQDDGGWSILKISNAVNSWVKNCTFKNVNNALSFSHSANATAIDVTINGNLGHSAIHSSRSTNILIANCNDIAGMHHSLGVDGNSSGTVIWRSKYAAHTSFESHASQPRCTLLDNVEGGFFQGRAGGARFNLPNHGKHLVLWNFKETDGPEENFRFVANDTWYWRIVPPIIVGFHGAGTTFKKDEVEVLESLGKPVTPESLFEKQLELRLGKLPQWIVNIKNKPKL